MRPDDPSRTLLFSALLGQKIRRQPHSPDFTAKNLAGHIQIALPSVLTDWTLSFVRFFEYSLGDLKALLRVEWGHVCERVALQGLSAGPAHEQGGC